MTKAMAENSAPKPDRNLEDESLKRKQRLLNLKRRREGASQPSNPDSSEPSLPKPLFRSYRPHDDRLEENALPEATPGDVDGEVAAQLEAGKEAMVIDQLDIATLAPRKPDWDLKRDVGKKLEKLERRTQRAIAELIRERLKEKEENLAELVNAGTNSKLVYGGDTNAN